MNTNTTDKNSSENSNVNSSTSFNIFNNEGDNIDTSRGLQTSRSGPHFDIDTKSGPQRTGRSLDGGDVNRNRYANDNSIDVQNMQQQEKRLEYRQGDSQFNQTGDVHHSTLPVNPHGGQAAEANLNVQVYHPGQQAPQHGYQGIDIAQKNGHLGWRRRRITT